MCDRILVLEDGKMVQIGTHEELLQDKRVLRKMKKILPLLTSVQRKTLYKLCVEKKGLVEIAEEEGIAKQSVADRIEGLRKKIKKFLGKLPD
jgi:predicted DNA-binding protein YlxM (UPF0122 family)